jgi:hypothetical protein
LIFTERPRVFKVRFGYNPNSSSHGAYFLIALLGGFIPLILFVSLIYADMMLRKIHRKTKIIKKIVFVLIPLASFFLFYSYLGLQEEGALLFMITFPALLLISIILYLFTRYRTCGLASGFFTIIGTIALWLCSIGEMPALIKERIITTLILPYIFGLIAGYPIDRKRMGKKDEGTF